MLEDINEKLKDKMSLLRKRLREPDMKEVYDSRFKSIIEIYKRENEKPINKITM
jgi:hypothetical protein